MACSKDRYADTYVVAPDLGPLNCQVADFTDIQAAINALPPTGGKIFVFRVDGPARSMRIGVGKVWGATTTASSESDICRYRLR